MMVLQELTETCYHDLLSQTALVQVKTVQNILKWVIINKEGKIQLIVSDEDAISFIKDYCFTTFLYNNDN